MTGSGKTGLCIDLLEEAALSGIPALLIDPKGDITNTLLHFPQLLPQDFQTLDQSRHGAPRWVKRSTRPPLRLPRPGRKGWQIGALNPSDCANWRKQRISPFTLPAPMRASRSASWRRYEAPELPWEGNEEMLREKISGTVTAILGLVGLRN